MESLTIMLQEAKRLGSTLEQLSLFLTENSLGTVEVLVVAADSPDGTVDFAHSKAGLFKDFRVIEAGPRAGKGRDVRLAMMEANGEYKLFMDADLATPLHHLNTVLQLMEKEADVIIGVQNRIFYGCNLFGHSVVCDKQGCCPKPGSSRLWIVFDHHCWIHPRTGESVGEYGYATVRYITYHRASFG